MFDLLDKIKKRTFAIGSNIYSGLSEVVNFPWRLYDLYQNPNIKPIVRQMAFYHCVCFGSAITLDYMSAYYAGSNDESADDNKPFGAYTATLLSGVLSSAIIYAFPLTYGIAFEFNYSDQAIIDYTNDPNFDMNFSCEHNQLSHLRTSIKVPFYFPLAMLETKLLLNADYMLNPVIASMLYLPGLLILGLTQMAAFEYNRKICQGRCPEEAFNELKNEYGFLLGEGIAYVGMMKLISSVGSQSLAPALLSALYHSFSLATVYRHKDGPKDEQSLYFLKTSEATIEKVKALLSQDDGPSDLPRKISRLLFEYAKMLKHVLPLQANWYNVPFHQTLGNYKALLESTSNSLSIANKYNVLSGISVIVGAAEYFRIVNKNGTRDFLLNQLDHQSLGLLLQDLAQVLKKDYQKNNVVRLGQKDFDEIVAWLSGFEVTNDNVVRNYTNQVVVRENYIKQTKEKEERKESMPQTPFMLMDTTEKNKENKTDQVTKMVNQ